MRGVGVGIALAVVLFGAVACSGGEAKTGGNGAGGKGGGAGGSGNTAAVPLPGPVTLPEEPGELGDVVQRQVQAARWVRAAVTYTARTGGGGTVAQLDARMRLGPGPPEALLKAVDNEGGKTNTTHAIMTGGLYFTRVEGEEQAKGKPWLRLSHTELNNGQLGPLAGLFTGVLSKLESEIQKLSVDSGTALVRNGKFKGEPVIENAGNLKLHRYQGSTDASAMAKLDPDYKAMAQRGFKEIPWTLWVADNGLPHKFRATVGRGETTVDAVTTYSGWGQPINVKPPPADQVATVADMTAG
jgi:LppX_LprAFG lipoprotein